MFIRFYRFRLQTITILFLLYSPIPFQLTLNPISLDSRSRTTNYTTSIAIKINQVRAEFFMQMHNQATLTTPPETNQINQPGLLSTAAYNLQGLISIIRGDIIHNTIGAYHVLRLWHVQKLKAGLIGLEHPWVTGINPETNAPIWPQNVVFRTPPDPGREFEPDERIVQKVGSFLADMVKKSARLPEIPHGPDRRMPHVVNYLHGSVHYNGMWLLFNDFYEAKHYFSDKAFRKEFKRLVKTEKREVTLIFRERKYDPLEYAYFSGFIMANFPWFANVNGPGKKVMWGNPSPYPAMNIINGSWVTDVEKLRKGRTDFVKPPVDTSRYFKGRYGAEPQEYQFVEKLVAYVENEWVRNRGFNAGLFFIDRKKIDPRIYEKYTTDKATLDERQFVIPSPLKRPKNQQPEV